jgi:hypothetical protein
MTQAPTPSFAATSPDTRPTPCDLALRQWDALCRLGAQADQGPAALAALAHAARSDTAELWTLLPPQYREVLLGLLDRLESSARFSEESCSFSQQELLAHVDTWMVQARARLHAKCNG